MKRYAEQSHAEYEILAMPAPVAALLTARSVAETLRRIPPKEYKVILTPGLMLGDVSPIEEATGVPTFKGPRYAADLPIVLDLHGQVKLSKVVPACQLLKDELKKRSLDELLAVEKKRDQLLRKPGNMLIGSLPVGCDFPMRVIAEIADAPLLSDEQIAERARHYQLSGAEMIDIGMTAGGGREDDARRAARAAKSAVDIPISIDTIDPAEAKAGVEAGAVLVLSVDGGNAEEMSGFAGEVAVVVIPTNHAEGYFPKDPDERVEAMKKNLMTARSLGMKRILADLIMDPVASPGFVKSIVSFYKFKMDEPEVPLFCGVGNVVELLDADTPGVNALAAAVASELGVSVLLTTEASDKCRGSVKELSTASKMMFLARRRESVPTDLGIDLLLFKDKRSLEEPYDPAILEGATEVQPDSQQGVPMDPEGCFKVMIGRERGEIVAIHYPMHQRERPDLFLKGKTAQEIYHAAVSSDLVSDLGHSAYLGYELGKAEIALRTGKSYVQDSTLFSW